MTISIILEQVRGYCCFVVARYVFPRTELTFPLLFSSGNECSSISANALSVVMLKPVDVFLSLRCFCTDSLSRTTLAAPGRLCLCLSFPEPYEACNLNISFFTTKALQNSGIHNEIETTTLKCQLEIHTSAFRSITAAMEEDTNQTSQHVQSRKWQVFHIRKMYFGAQSTLDDNGS